MRRLLFSLLAIGLVTMTIGCRNGFYQGRCDCLGDGCCLGPAPWQMTDHVVGSEVVPASATSTPKVTKTAGDS